MESPFPMDRADPGRQNEVRIGHRSSPEYQRRRSRQTPRHPDRIRQIPSCVGRMYAIEKQTLWIKDEEGRVFELKVVRQELT